MFKKSLKSSSNTLNSIFGSESLYFFLIISIILSFDGSLLKEYVRNLKDHKNDYQLYEYLEWKTRQARYLVRNQRVYEFFNFDWRLPLWDQRLVEFFLYANFEEKYPK